MTLMEIVTFVIALVALVLGAVVIPLIRKKYGQETLDRVVVWIDEFVKAAEQVFDHKQGAEKKEYVLSLIQKRVDEMGIKIDVTVLEALIESAVLKLHNSLKHDANYI